MRGARASGGGGAMGRRGVEKMGLGLELEFMSELEGGLVHDVSEFLGWWAMRTRRCGGM